MNTTSIKAAAKTLGEILHKNSPHILTGLGVTGLVSTAVFSWNAGKITERIATEKKIEDPKEIAKACWKFYIRPVIIGSASIACIVGSDCINTNRAAALASLYSAAVEGAKEYQEKVIETFGESKAQKVKDDIYADKVKENPSKDTQIIVTGKGGVKCYDAYSGRYFWGDIENIRRVQNDLNQALIADMWISLNDVYYALGMHPIKYGDEIGWNVDNMIDFTFSSQLDEDNVPVLVMDYEIGPRHDFRNLM